MLHRSSHSWRIAILLLIVIAISLSCAKTPNPLVLPSYATSQPSDGLAQSTEAAQPDAAPALDGVFLPGIRGADDTSIHTPTPDALRVLPTLRTETEEYVVQAGDSLGSIANRYGISLQAVVNANGLTNPDLLSAGQVLVIPPPQPGLAGTSYKTIPDSELVFGPRCDAFDVSEFVSHFDSYLSRYQEEVEGATLTGVQIVERVAREYSVGPRLLLAVLEYQSGWVTQANPEATTRQYPIGIRDSWREGLYLQLAWAANNLSRGFYLWRVNAVGVWLLADGSSVPIDATINAGTAGVQQMFALLYDRANWDRAVSPEGVFQTFGSFFGYPFDYAVEPLIPAGLTQPEMQLPFEPGVVWAFTGGPHGGWADGSAWAGLDFAPDVNGCEARSEWVTAVADGLVIRSEYGAVVQDLDGDGLEGTGWTVLYMHIATTERVTVGTYLQAGERIGHPSCEGGFSTGTHLHLARRYNGEWIAADQNIPFVLDGWVSSGTGIYYDGYLTREGQTLEAWDGFFPANTLSRP
jgi:murein DD-endopeptidase MepM/ murein hydrolase activator NlpD